MNKNWIWAALLGAAMIACKSDTAKCHDEHMEAAAADSSAGDGIRFGAEFSPIGAISYDELLKQMEGQDTLVTKLMGTVHEVCQIKGCWMNIAASDTNQLPLHITFKDYGYTVPKEISGKKVAMEGFAYYEETGVEELRHLAEDAGKPRSEIDAITEPQVELKYEATGVVILQ